MSGASTTGKAAVRSFRRADIELAPSAPERSGRLLCEVLRLRAKRRPTGFWAGHDTRGHMPKEVQARVRTDAGGADASGNPGSQVVVRDCRIARQGHSGAAGLGAASEARGNCPS